MVGDVKKKKIGFGDVSLSYSWRLPEECTSHIISLTSPKYASILSTVSKSFKAAADSDIVWDRFLPPDYKHILARSDDAHPVVYSSKKELYFRLCDSPLLLDAAQLSFRLSKPSGNKCYMLGARKLFIKNGDISECWEWKTIAESRFPEVAQLVFGSDIVISGTTQTKILSSNTKYAAYIVFRYHTSPYLVSVLSYAKPAGELEGGSSAWRIGSRPWVDRRVQIRSEEWMELELGEFFVNGGDDDDIDMYFELNHAPCWSIGGHIIQGIELRPKE